MACVSADPEINIDVKLQNPQPVAVTDFETKVRNRMIEKFINFAKSRKMIIFGSFVREYICGRPFDHTSSDIDVFSKEISVSHISNVLNGEGFTVVIDQSAAKEQRYTVSKQPFLVSRLTIGLMNCEMFLDKKLEILVDFVQGKHLKSKRLLPPFNCLDFECNAFIWDKHGIRLSRNTGTLIDSMSEKEIKEYEQKIIQDAKSKIALYVPTDKLPKPPKGVNPQANYFRKMRAKRIVKLLVNGWEVKHFSGFVINTPSKDDNCTICGDEIINKYFKLSCQCGSKYDYECFTKFIESELNDKTFIRCVQRCAEIYL